MFLRGDFQRRVGREFGRRVHLFTMLADVHDGGNL